jgi:hypothetical protein
LESVFDFSFRKSVALPSKLYHQSLKEILDISMHIIRKVYKQYIINFFVDLKKNQYVGKNRRNTKTSETKGFFAGLYGRNAGFVYKFQKLV